jgi:putative hydrolase of the HAD superfamily
MVSSDYCVRKPGTLLFETAAARLGMLPTDIWFVGDRVDLDIIGAKAAGMTSVWLRHNNAEDPSSSTADLVVPDWTDLIERFQAVLSGNS